MDIIVKVGEMIQLRDYNVKSSLNMHAAHWVSHGKEYLPIGHVDLYQAEVPVELVISQGAMHSLTSDEKKNETKDKIDIGFT